MPLSAGDSWALENRHGGVVPSTWETWSTSGWTFARAAAAGTLDHRALAVVDRTANRTLELPRPHRLARQLRGQVRRDRRPVSQQRHVVGVEPGDPRQLLVVGWPDRIRRFV